MGRARAAAAPASAVASASIAAAASRWWGPETGVALSRKLRIAPCPLRADRSALVATEDLPVGSVVAAVPSRRVLSAARMTGDAKSFNVERGFAPMLPTPGTVLEAAQASPSLAQAHGDAATAARWVLLALHVAAERAAGVASDAARFPAVEGGGAPGDSEAAGSRVPRGWPRAEWFAKSVTAAPPAGGVAYASGAPREPWDIVADEALRACSDVAERNAGRRAIERAAREEMQGYAVAFDALRQAQAEAASSSEDSFALPPQSTFMDAARWIAAAGLWIPLPIATPPTESPPRKLQKRGTDETESTDSEPAAAAAAEAEADEMAESAQRNLFEDEDCAVGPVLDLLAARPGIKAGLDHATVALDVADAADVRSSFPWVLTAGGFAAAAAERSPYFVLSVGDGGCPKGIPLVLEGAVIDVAVAPTKAGERAELARRLGRFALL